MQKLWQRRGNSCAVLQASYLDHEHNPQVYGCSWLVSGNKDLGWVTSPGVFPSPRRVSTSVSAPPAGRRVSALGQRRPFDHGSVVYLILIEKAHWRKFSPQPLFTALSWFIIIPSLFTILSLFIIASSTLVPFSKSHDQSRGLSGRCGLWRSTWTHQLLPAVPLRCGLSALSAGGRSRSCRSLWLLINLWMNIHDMFRGF